MDGAVKYGKEHVSGYRVPGVALDNVRWKWLMAILGKRHRQSSRFCPGSTASRIRQGDSADRSWQGLNRGRRQVLLRHESLCGEGSSHN